MTVANPARCREKRLRYQRAVNRRIELHGKSFTISAVSRPVLKVEACPTQVSMTLAHTRPQGSRASQNQIFCLDEVQSACVLRWSRCSLRQLESEGFKLFEPQGLSSQTRWKCIDVFCHSRKIC